MNAGKITIDLDAGTPQFLIDMEKANGKLRDFSGQANSARNSLRSIGDGGAQAATGVQATSAALAALEVRMAAAERGIQAATKNAEQVGKAVEEAGKKGAGMGEEVARGAARAAEAVAKFTVGAGESVIALVSGHAVLSAALAKYSGTAVASGATTENLVNTYRALRIALSPTPFTVATIAAGVLIEEMTRLVNIRAKLIEQQSLVAARTGLPIQTVERIDTVAGLSGANSQQVRGLYKALSSRTETDQQAVRSGLETLQLPASLATGPISTDLLARIAAGFASIEDPAKRAEAAVALFGQDHAAEALEELNEHFASASDAAGKYGLALDSLSRNQIFTFHRDMQRVKDALTDFSTFRSWWQGFVDDSEIVGAAAWDMAKRIAKSVDDSIASLTGLRGALSNAINPPKLTPEELSQTGPAARKQDIEAGIVADQIFAEAQGAKQRQAETLEGLKAQQAAAQARADAAYQKLAQDQEHRRRNQDIISGGGARAPYSILSGQERESLALEQQSAAATAVVLGQQVSAIEAQQAAAEKAQNAMDARADSYATKIRELTSDVKGLGDQLSAIGKGQDAERLAKAWTEAHQWIEKTNGELLKLSPDKANPIRLSPEQEKNVENLYMQRVGAQNDVEWKTKLQQATAELGNEIQAIKLRRDAIGKGYEAQRAAFVEAEKSKLIGDHAKDPEWMRQHQPEIDQRATQAGNLFDQRQGESNAQRLDQLQDQIDLERELAAVESLGAEAIRQATLAYNARKLARDVDADSAEKLAVAEKELSDAQAKRQAQSDISRLNQEIEAIERLTAAQLGGAEAIRKAQLENRIAEIRKNTPAAFQGAEIRKAQQLSEAQHQQEVLEAALKTGIAYQNRLDAIDEQVAALEKLKAEQGDTLAIEISLRTLEQERAKIFADQVSVLGTARDGMRSFFAEMATDGVSSAKEVHDSLKNAFDGLNDTLARLLSGQRVSWASFFQGISADLAKVSLRNLEAQIAQRVSRTQHSGQQPTTVAGRIGRTIGDIFHAPVPSAPKNALRDGQTPGTAWFVTGVSRSGEPSVSSQPAAGNLEAPLPVPVSVPAAAAPASIPVGPTFTSIGRPTVMLPEGSTDESGPSGEIPLPNRSVIPPGQKPGWDLPTGALKSLPSMKSTLGNIGLDLGVASIGLLTMLFDRPKDRHLQPGNPYTIPNFGGYRANGGPVDPGSVYEVGEHGFELWSPPEAGGSIISHEDLMAAKGHPGKGGDVYIDARGTDPMLVEKSVRRGMETTHNAAVRTSFRTYTEYNKRIPAK